MSHQESLPFARGTTFFDGGTTDTTSGRQLEGREYDVPDVDPRSTGTGSATYRTSRMVRVRIVRNKTGFALLPKKLVSFGTEAGKSTGQANGHVRLTADPVQGVVDEYLPSAGCPDGDLCYVVVAGPALCLPDLAAGANNVLPVETRVVSLTAATSGATTAGRIAPQDITGATSLLANQIQNCVGKVLTARTTANTTSDVLVDVGKW